MITKKDIGKIIQNLRKQKGLTQEELAEKVDISTNYLSKVERGLNILNAETFIRMAKVLSFTFDDFGIAHNAETKENKIKNLLLKKILSAPTKKLEIYESFIETIDKTILH